MTVLVVVVALFLVALVIAIVIVSYVASRKLASPPRKRLSWTPRDMGLDYLDFEHTTRDGIKLMGWLVKGSNEKAVILIHGYTSSKWDPDYMKPALEFLGKMGYTVLAVDMRAHGDSGGDVTTLGYKESDDVVELVNYLRNQGFKKICLYGYSMGGATAVIASTKVNVDALVLDSPYVDIRTTGRRWINRVKGPLRLLLKLSYPLIVFFTATKIGVKPDELVMHKYATRISAPVLLVAPVRDDLISLDEFKALETSLKKSGKDVESWFVDTGHVEAWKNYREVYMEKLKSFLDKSL